MKEKGRIKEEGEVKESEGRQHEKQTKTETDRMDIKKPDI